MTSFSGRNTAMRRGAARFNTSRTALSNIATSTRLLARATPMRRTNSRIASGGTPRRRNPAKVGMRGSSQPDTWPSCTSRVRNRFDSTV